MAFAINPSLNYLNVNAAHVLDLYKSTAEVSIPDARFRGHSFEAYICITKVELEWRAYVALLNTSLQTVLIYTSELVAKKASDYPQVHAEAEAFVTSMGFTMEKVNLEFSAAMKEVILKGFRVMRAPPPPKKQVIRQPRIDISTGLSNELEIENLPTIEVINNNRPLDLKTDLQSLNTENNGMSDSNTELQTLRTELVSVRTALAQLTRDKVSLEQRFSQERASLKSACEQAMESKRLTEERLAGEARDRSKSDQSRQSQLEKEAEFEREKQERLKQHQIDKEEISSLKKQLVMTKEAAEVKEKQLVMAKEAAEVKEKQLQQKMTELVGKVNLLVNEKDKLEQKLASEAGLSGELLAKAHADMASVESLLAAEKKANLEAAARLTALGRAEQSWKEGEQQTEELSRSLVAVEGELSAAKAELEMLRQGEQKQEELLKELSVTKDELDVARVALKKSSSEKQGAEELVQSLAALTEELDAAKAELTELRNNRPAGGEVPAEISQAVKEKEDVEAEYARLATASREKELELADSLATAEAENARLSQELEIQTQVAAMEQAALRAELRRLIVGGQVSPLSGQTEELYPAGTAMGVAMAQDAPSGSPQPGQPVQVVYAAHPGSGLAPTALSNIVQASEPVSLLQVEEEEEPDDTPDETMDVDTSVIKEFTNEYGGFYIEGETSSSEFAIDPSINSIEYHQPSEILAVFYSSNSVQAVPDSSSIQRCKGYVIALKLAEEYRVYVAWHLTESGKVVVCLPDQQPVDSESCVQVLRDAIFYFEIVGFMMDIVDLGTTLKSYKKALKKIPVLRLISSN